MSRAASHEASVRKVHPTAFVLPALVVVAVLFGGGGAPAPLAGLVVEWAALAALVAAIWLDDGTLPWPRLALGFAAVLIALPLAQLAPLPPALWHALPGRSSEIAALGLVEGSRRWMPWSVSPPRTWASLFALIPPAVALVLAARSPPSWHRRTLGTIAAMGLLTVVVGAAQLAGGGSGLLRFYAESHVGFLTGFQANRNAAADLLLIAMLALVAWGLKHAPSPAARLIVGAGLVTLVVGVLLTGSRAGMALLLALGPGLVWWFARGSLRRLRPSARVAAAGAAILALAGTAALLASSDVARRMAGRFAQSGDPRPELWTDTLYAIGQYWPLGSGLGSFVPVFVAAERLEVVDASLPNRAHNDFLELALEAGLPGLIVLIALAAVLIWKLTARLRGADSPAERAELVFAGATLLVLGLHSIVDYPLRSMSLATLAGVAAGSILAPRPQRAQRAPPRVENNRA